MTSQGEGLTLKPCPFCGRAPAVIDDDSYGGCWVGCAHCDVCPEGAYLVKGLVPQAIIAWNTRTPPTGKCETALTLLAEATNDIDAATWCHGPKWVEKVNALLSARPDCQPTGITESERYALELGAECIVWSGLHDEKHVEAAATLRALCAKLGGSHE